jgi:hypothetical protein
MIWINMINGWNNLEQYEKFNKDKDKYKYKNEENELIKFNKRLH